MESRLHAGVPFKGTSLIEPTCLWKAPLGLKQHSGATFDIYLPRCLQEPVWSFAPTSIPENAGSSTVPVVDFPIDVHLITGSSTCWFMHAETSAQQDLQAASNEGEM